MEEVRDIGVPDAEIIAAGFALGIGIGGQVAVLIDQGG